MDSSPTWFERGISSSCRRRRHGHTPFTLGRPCVDAQVAVQSRHWQATRVLLHLRTMHSSKARLPVLSQWQPVTIKRFKIISKGLIDRQCMDKNLTITRKMYLTITRKMYLSKYYYFVNPHSNTGIWQNCFALFNVCPLDLAAHDHTHAARAPLLNLSDKWPYFSWNVQCPLCYFECSK